MLNRNLKRMHKFAFLSHHPTKDVTNMILTASCDFFCSVLAICCSKLKSDAGEEMVPKFFQQLIKKIDHKYDLVIVEAFKTLTFDTSGLFGSTAVAPASNPQMDIPHKLRSVDFKLEKIANECKYTTEVLYEKEKEIARYEKSLSRRLESITERGENMLAKVDQITREQVAKPCFISVPLQTHLWYTIPTTYM